MEGICEKGPTAYGPYPRRLESLTICRCNCKGSTFSSVILKPWVMVELTTSRTAALCSTNWDLRRDGSDNATNFAYLMNKNKSFARPPRTFYTSVHFVWFSLIFWFSLDSFLLSAILEWSNNTLAHAQNSDLWPVSNQFVFTWFRGPTSDRSESFVSVRQLEWMKPAWDDFSDRLHVNRNKYLYGDRSEVVPVWVRTGLM